MIKGLMARIGRVCRIIGYRIKSKKNRTHISLTSTIRNSRLRGDNYIAEKCIIIDSDVGEFTYCSQDCKISHTRIGKYTSIAQGFRVFMGNHPTRKFVSTSPALYQKSRGEGRCFAETDMYDDVYDYADEENGWICRIGNDVWIASDVRILGGVTIGDGAVVCAGALVNKDVPPYAIVAGVPARIIRFRFSEKEIQWLLDLKWWDKSEKWVREHVKFFNDIESLMKECE